VAMNHAGQDDWFSNCGSRPGQAFRVRRPDHFARLWGLPWNANKAADNVSLGGFQAGDDYALAPDFDRPSIKVLASLADRFFILVAFNDVRWCADAPSLV
jgi:hypothetical protein